MNLLKRKSAILLLCLISMIKVKSSYTEFDCQAPRPEMAGHHNMIVFGVPGDQKYAYHLPLFAGKINGHHGHVFMHVYQGVWNIDFDTKTNLAYEEKFLKTTSEDVLIPLFSLSPRGQRFKVPELICGNNFSTEALTVYGHVESNPDFPAPELLTGELSSVKFSSPSVFARKFDGSKKSDLTYILFGTDKQQYLAHYLTDNENSFDQILAVNVKGELLDRIKLEKSILVNIPISENRDILDIVNDGASINNKFTIISDQLLQNLKISHNKKLHSISINSEIYFNNNSDLKVK